MPLCCVPVPGPCCRLAEEQVPFLGAFPEDKLLRAVRLDEVLPALNAEYMYGSSVQLDQVRSRKEVLLFNGSVRVLLCVTVALLHAHEFTPLPIYCVVAFDVPRHSCFKKLR